MRDEHGLTKEERRGLDRELLERLAARSAPITLPDLFGQSWAPQWAVLTADRRRRAVRVDGGRARLAPDSDSAAERIPRRVLTRTHE